jgi:hypothetical protein
MGTCWLSTGNLVCVKYLTGLLYFSLISTGTFVSKYHRTITAELFALEQAMVSNRCGPIGTVGRFMLSVSVRPVIGSQLPFPA